EVDGVTAPRPADRDRHMLGAQRRSRQLPPAEDAEPPDVVPSAVAAGRPVVRADGEVDPPPGLLELGGDLDAGGPGPDHEDVARPELLRVAVVSGVDLPDVGRSG